jgi:hypothetical protein
VWVACETPHGWIGSDPIQIVVKRALSLAVLLVSEERRNTSCFGGKRGLSQSL